MKIPKKEHADFWRNSKFKPGERIEIKSSGKLGIVIERRVIVKPGICSFSFVVFIIVEKCEAIFSQGELEKFKGMK